ncbi:hypothetical protein Dimus_013107 [Dionaea muscipula]
MSIASSPSDPNASEEIPNATSLAIVVLEPPRNSSNPTSNIPSSSNAGAPRHNDPPSSDESGEDSEVDSDASGFKDDSDDNSSSESSPLQSRPRRPAHAPLIEGANTSLSLPLYSSSITNHDAEPFIRVKDPAEGEYYVDIMSNLDDPLAPDSENAQNVTSFEAESPSMALTDPRKRFPTPIGIPGSHGEHEEGEIVPPPRSD